MLRAGIVQVVDTINFREHVVSERGVIAKEGNYLQYRFPGDDDGHHSAKFADQEFHLGEIFCFKGSRAGWWIFAVMRPFDCTKAENFLRIAIVVKQARLVKTTTELH